MMVFQDSTHIICPLCDAKYEKPKPLEVDPGGIDVALGLAPGTMRLQAEFERSQQLENVLRYHFTEGHKIDEWVGAVVKRETVLREIQGTLSTSHAYGDIEKILGANGYPIERKT